MRTETIQILSAVAFLCVMVLTTSLAQTADRLPSWNEGKAKKSIMDFVAKVTREGSPYFVPPVIGAVAATLPSPTFLPSTA